MNIFERLYKKWDNMWLVRNERKLDSMYIATHKPPMGVSQWRAHGEKYGYWNYFKEQIQSESGSGQTVCRKPHKLEKRVRLSPPRPIKKKR